MTVLIFIFFQILASLSFITVGTTFDVWTNAILSLSNRWSVQISRHMNSNVVRQLETSHLSASSASTQLFSFRLASPVSATSCYADRDSISPTEKNSLNGGLRCRAARRSRARSAINPKRGCVQNDNGSFWATDKPSSSPETYFCSWWIWARKCWKKDPDFRFCNIILVLVLISVLIISLDYRLSLTVAVH